MTWGRVNYQQKFFFKVNYSFNFKMNYPFNIPLVNMCSFNYVKAYLLHKYAFAIMN